MKNKYIFYITIVFLITGVSQASEYYQPGGYAGISFGATNSGAKAGNLANSCQDPGEQCTVDNTDQAWQIQGGYNITPNFSVEGAYTDLGTVASFDNGNISADHKTKGVSVSAIGKMPIGGRTNLYGKAGIYHWQSDTSATDRLGTTITGDNDGTDPVVGIGAEFRLSPNWSARIGWDRYFSVGEKTLILNNALSTVDALDTDVNVYSVGIHYDF